MKVSHSKRKSDLGYLCEDTRKHLEGIADFTKSDPYLMALVESCRNRLDSLSVIDIGSQHQLNEIQYLLGEMQVGLNELDFEYKVISRITDEIQSHLDWAYCSYFV